MNELQLCVDQNFQNAFYATHFALPGEGEFGYFQPGANNPMGFDDLKVIEASRLMQSIVEGKPYGATIHDALIAARTVDAMVRSADERKWVSL